MSANHRIASVDLLRGLVMIVMALDHVRNYFGATPALPEEMAEPGLGLFLTRWITHFCAPVFVFLSGTSAWLYRHNSGCSPGVLRRFLVTRGLWLIAVEFVLVTPAWPLWLDGFLLAQVIWVLGWSMLLMGLLLPLGHRALLVLGLAMIFGHNLLDGIDAAQWGDAAFAWIFLHQEGVVPLGGGWNLFIAYPLIPWLGVMMAGYGFGAWMTRDAGWKRKAPLLGMAAIALFFALRGGNVYGDPGAWQAGADFARSLVNFLNVAKYPPSLQFLLMTLGPALLLMPLLERWTGRAAGVVSVFGRVPFFYYVLHFPLIYGAAIAWSHWRYDTAFWWFRGEQAFPPGYTLDLGLVYAVWIAVVVALYPACRWYADLKRRRKDLWWLSYL